MSLDGLAPALREPRRAAAILDATVALLVERGYQGLTVEGVADRSGVNKTTIYRWWPSKADLVGAAIRRGRLLAFTVPDTGTLRGDLQALLDHVVRLVTTSPTAELAQALLAGTAQSPELAEQTSAFFLERLQATRTITERACARGELAASHSDPALLLDLLNGAIWMRALIRRAAISAEFTAHLLDAVLDGVRPSSAVSTDLDTTLGPYGPNSTLTGRPIK